MLGFCGTFSWCIYLICSSPLFFLLQTIAFTQSVGSFSLLMAAISSISSNSFFYSSISCIGYFLGSWMTGIAFSIRCIFSFPGKLPIPLNMSGYSFVRSSILSICLLVVMLPLICTNLNFRHGLRPSIAVSFSHKKNLALIAAEFWCLIVTIIEPYCWI